ncbi:MAG: hypothetical protein ACYDAE_29275, partial [Steroidobacteraceae bacterium]
SAAGDLRMQAHFTVALRKLKRILQQITDRRREHLGIYVNDGVMIRNICIPVDVSSRQNSQSRPGARSCKPSRCGDPMLD